MSTRVFWGVVLVLTGALLLATNLAPFDVHLWPVVWKVWPLLLVLWGVAILLRPAKTVGAVITAALVLAAFAAVALYAASYPTAEESRTGIWRLLPELPGREQRYTLEQPLEPDVTQARLHLAFGAGELTVKGDAAQDRLATGTLEYVGSPPDVRYSRSDQTTDLGLGLRGRTVWFGASDIEWDIQLGRVPAWVLELDLGATEAELDLSALRVTELDLEAGASSVELRLGDAGVDTQARFKLGAAKMRLDLPRSVGVRVTVSGAALGHNLSEAGFARSGDTWLSPGYEDKTTRLTLDLEAGAGSFEVHWTD
ncbi:MAG: toast rack family protein [Firmicutes bacterium]|nr:toast rack family protein [Bacillota bacterium]